MPVIMFQTDKQKAIELGQYAGAVAQLMRSYGASDELICTYIQRATCQVPRELKDLCMSEARHSFKDQKAFDNYQQPIYNLFRQRLKESVERQMQK